MKSSITNFILKASVKSFSCLTGLILFASATANDGKPSSVAVKGSVPLNYYQAFMVGIAVIYGVYLIVRAKRRNRKNKFGE